MKPAIHIIILITLVACFQSLSTAREGFIKPGEKAPAFILNDQFITNDSLHNYSGEILVMMYSGRNTSDYAKYLSAKILDRFCPSPTLEQHRDNEPSPENDDCAVNVLGIAFLRGVPFFIKRRIKNYFLEEGFPSVLLDWKGEIAEGYGYDGDALSVFVVDEEGVIALADAFPLEEGAKDHAVASLDMKEVLTAAENISFTGEQKIFGVVESLVGHRSGEPPADENPVTDTQ